MKYLGIDYGTKKVGFAESDGEGKLAFPMMISENNKDLIRDTLEIVKGCSIDGIVIGLSLDKDGKENPVAAKAKKFAEELKEKLTEKNLNSIKIIFEKEWYTTVEARKQPEAKENVDDAAAALILQRYLDKVKPREYAEDNDEDEGSDD
jgi:putative holliday junction resolvase